jgi:thiol-disulfide isomerase/thioredoxin
VNLTSAGGVGSYWVVPQVKRFGCLVAALAIGLGAAACSSSESAVDNGSGFVQSKPGYSEVSVAKRAAAPALKGSTLTDTQLALASLKGKVVVVNFWGSWCAPCRAESAALESVAKSTAASGVTFVGVAERDTKSNASSFVTGHGVTYPSILDDDGSLAAPWPGATGPPYTFIVDRQGRIAARFLGGVTTEELQSAVLKVTAEA